MYTDHSFLVTSMREIHVALQSRMKIQVSTLLHIDSTGHSLVAFHVLIFHFFYFPCADFHFFIFLWHEFSFFCSFSFYVSLFFCSFSFYVFVFLFFVFCVCVDFSFLFFSVLFVSRVLFFRIFSIYSCLFFKLFCFVFVCVYFSPFYSFFMSSFFQFVLGERGGEFVSCFFFFHFFILIFLIFLFCLHFFHLLFFFVLWLNFHASWTWKDGQGNDCLNNATAWASGSVRQPWARPGNRRRCVLGAATQEPRSFSAKFVFLFVGGCFLWQLSLLVLSLGV